MVSSIRLGPQLSLDYDRFITAYGDLGVLAMTMICSGTGLLTVKGRQLRRVFMVMLSFDVQNRSVGILAYVLLCAI